MIFRIVRASDYWHATELPAPGAVKSGDDWTISIDTLEELVALQAAVKFDLALGSDSIWIYDDYME